MPIAYILWIFFTKFCLCVHSIALFHVESIRNAYMIGFLHSQPWFLGGPIYTDLPYMMLYIGHKPQRVKGPNNHNFIVMIAVKCQFTHLGHSGNRVKQSATGIRAVCFKSPSHQPVTVVHGMFPRPALKDFWNNTVEARKTCRLFQKSIPAARHGRPSTNRTNNGPLWRTLETIGVRNPCLLFQKSIPVARHGRPSRTALTNFWNKRRPKSPMSCWY